MKTLDHPAWPNNVHASYEYRAASTTEFAIAQKVRQTIALLHKRVMSGSSPSFARIIANNASCY